GIGFGKTVDQNFELVRRLDELVAIGRPILIGFSRKSSLARILGRDSSVGTTAASVGAAVAAYEHGATILRAHDVRDLLEALATHVADALFAQFAPRRLKLRVRKRPAGLGVEHSAVTVQRP